MYNLLAGALFLLIVKALDVECHNVRVNCYISKVWQPFPFQDIASRCTHVTYFFAEIKNSIVVPIDDNQADNYAKLMRIKNYNRSLKVLIAIGRWNNADARSFSMVSATSDMRTKFASSVLNFSSSHGFDGVLLNWIDPADKVRGRTEDFRNYVELVRELRSVLNGSSFEIGATGSPFRPNIRRGYNVKQLSDLLDVIELRTFLFYTAKNVQAGHNAPLRSEQNSLSVEAAVGFWTQYGAEPSKLSIVIPFFGTRQELLNVSDFEPYAETANKSKVELVTTQDVCKLRSNYDERFVHEWSSPILVSGTKWISFENEESVVRKVAFARNGGLAGVSILSLERDDFDDSCGQGSFPLLSALSKEAKCKASDPLSIDCPAGHTLKEPNDLGSVCVDNATWEYFEPRACVLNLTSIVSTASPPRKFPETLPQTTERPLIDNSNTTQNSSSLSNNGTVSVIDGEKGSHFNHTSATTVFSYLAEYDYWIFGTVIVIASVATLIFVNRKRRASQNTITPQYAY